MCRTALSADWQKWVNLCITLGVMVLQNLRTFSVMQSIILKGKAIPVTDREGP
jgi:hypothetical protein